MGQVQEEMEAFIQLIYVAELKFVDGGTFDKEVLKSKKPVIVDMYADWCHPCQLFAPIFEEAAKKHGSKIKFVKLNVDESGDVAAKHEVFSIPTTLVFKNGKEVERKVGFLNKEQLKALLEKYV